MHWLLLLIGLALLLGLVVLHAVRRFDPRLARCVEPTATGYRARLNGWDRDAHFLLFVGTFLALAALLRFSGATLHEPAWQVASSLIPMAITVWAMRSEPFTQFLTDDAESGTLSWPGGSVRRDAVTGVEVAGNAVQLVGPEPMVVARFRRPADTGALAEWLRERLNVGGGPRADALGYVMPPPSGADFESRRDDIT